MSIFSFIGALVLVAFVYYVVGVGVVLFIAVVLRDFETYENVDMPSDFNLAIATWPYRVLLCFDAWRPKQDDSTEVKELKKNPLD